MPERASAAWARSRSGHRPVRHGLTQGRRLMSRPGGSSGRLDPARPSAPSSASGRLGPGQARPTVTPIELTRARHSGDDAHRPAATVPRRRPRLWLAALAGFGALSAVAIVTMMQLRQSAQVNGDGYRVACTSCGKEFTLPPQAFREGLRARSDRSVNRIRCAHCGRPDAVYRLDSGMAGLGELGPDGTPVSNPRQAPNR